MCIYHSFHTVDSECLQRRIEVMSGISIDRCQARLVSSHCMLLVWSLTLPLWLRKKYWLVCYRTSYQGLPIACRPDQITFPEPDFNASFSSVSDMHIFKLLSSSPVSYLSIMSSCVVIIHCRWLDSSKWSWRLIKAWLWVILRALPHPVLAPSRELPQLTCHSLPIQKTSALKKENQKNIL